MILQSKNERLVWPLDRFDYIFIVGFSDPGHDKAGIHSYLTRVLLTLELYLPVVIRMQ